MSPHVIRPFDDPNRDLARWSTVSATYVKPEREREPQWLEWSPLDKMFPKFLSSYFFLYKPKKEFGLDDVLPMDRLVESLRKVLVIFYPFAGRLITEDSDPIPRLYCNDEGALFLHKQYAGVVSELIDEDQFQPNELISGLFDFEARSDRYPAGGLPTLIIQVTDFRCGTRCLSTSWSHMVADGFSGTHFLSSWAELSRGEDVSLMPVVDHSLLSAQKFDKMRLSQFLSDDKFEHSSSTLPIPEGGLGCKTWKLSKARMDSLKIEALIGVGESTRLSTLDCVAAFLWRSITLHRNMKPQDRVRFVCIVNARPRAKDIPMGYFGNCALLVSCDSSVEDLLSKPLGHAALLIHNAIQAVDDETVRLWINLLTLEEFYSKIMPLRLGEGEPRVNVGLCIASWQNRFPFFEVDFGCGPPAAVLRNGYRMNHLNVGSFFGLPTSTMGDVALTLFAENKVLAKLGDLEW